MVQVKIHHVLAQSKKLVGCLTLKPFHTMRKFEEAPPGYEWIFRPWIKKKDGTIIRAKKGRMLRLLVKIK